MALGYFFEHVYSLQCSLSQWSYYFFSHQLKTVKIFHNSSWLGPNQKGGTLLHFCPFTGHMKVRKGASVGLNLKQLTLIHWTHMEQGHPCTSGYAAGCQEPRTASKHVGRQSSVHSGPTSATRDMRSCDSLYYSLKRWFCPTVTHPSVWLMCCHSLMLQSMLYYANLILMDPHW